MSLFLLCLFALTPSSWASSGPSAASAKAHLASYQKAYGEIRDTVHQGRQQVAQCELKEDAVEDDKKRRAKGGKQQQVRELRMSVYRPQGRGVPVGSEVISRGLLDSLPLNGDSYRLYGDIEYWSRRADGHVKNVAAGEEELKEAANLVTDYSCNSGSSGGVGLGEYIKGLDRRIYIHSRMPQYYGEKGAQGLVDRALRDFRGQFEGKRFINTDLNAGIKPVSCANTTENMARFEQNLMKASQALRGLADYHANMKTFLEKHKADMQDIQRRCKSQ